MLRFNTSSLLPEGRTKFISIHPMLRFNKTEQPFLSIDKKFQYILCYGSTFSLDVLENNAIEFQYILCYGSTY